MSAFNLYVLASSINSHKRFLFQFCRILYITRYFLDVVSFILWTAQLTIVLHNNIVVFFSRRKRFSRMFYLSLAPLCAHRSEYWRFFINHYNFIGIVITSRLIIAVSMILYKSKSLNFKRWWGENKGLKLF